MKQGDIYTADLGPMEKHEQGGFRPVLIMQNDIMNKNLSTLVVAPLTSNLAAKDTLTTYFLPKTLSRLQKDSLILLYQIRAIGKTRLKKKVTSLSPKEFVQIRSQLLLIFWNV